MDFKAFMAGFLIASVCWFFTAGVQGGSNPSVKEKDKISKQDKVFDDSEVDKVDDWNKWKSYQKKLNKALQR